MRISTSQIYDNGVFNIQNGQSAAYRLQNQLSTGRRIVTPADDPVAAGQALLTEQKKNVNQQFLDNQANAMSQLKELESLMGGVDELLIQCKSRWVEAGNGAYSDNELKSIAMDMRGKLAEMFGIANNSDANGLYRFAGYEAATRPFISNNNVVSYQGDSGERLLQVETGRFMAVSFSGREFFEKIPTGNGYFVANPGAGNTGSGVIDNGSMLGNYDGKTYTLTFTGADSFDIFDGTTTTSVTGYHAGDPINLGGAQVSITGSPNTGDTFTVAPSREESIFTTLNTFINTLETGDSGSADFRNAMNRIGASLDQALQHVLDNRAVVGARMAELDDLTTLGKDLSVQYDQQISGLVDLDYAKAISDLAKNQLRLEASQQSFVKVTGLSLFNYL
ncbi:MAG: flagellar hook-associated protein FlgL [Zoogloeaceae bacterium]|jgi:flagellar hook-associated protein 3 FlgL|nr:flagellar hook-associated protein FlgL [Zoogloeaceae bacterium]